MTSINIDLTPELEGVIANNLKTGLYKNSEEFIRDLIRNHSLHSKLIHFTKLENLREQLQAGIKDIENKNIKSLSYDDFINELNS
jgi:putative addiction module CopG family antidote